MEAHDIALALKILDRGAAKNPDMWLFPFEAGHIARMQLKDDKLAGVFGKAAAVPGCLTIRRLCELDLQDRGLPDGLKHVEISPRPTRVKRASNHLYQVKAAMDIAGLTAAVGRFKEKYGRFPPALDRLVPADVLATLPKDMDGRDYVYDPGTGVVSAPSIWWKR
jgi:hypothetical protein